MLTLVFGRFVSEAMVNRSLDLCLIAKETTIFYGHKFVFTHVLYEDVTKCYSTYKCSRGVSLQQKLQVTLLWHKCNGRN